MLKSKKRTHSAKKKKSKSYSSLRQKNGVVQLAAPLQKGDLIQIIAPGSAAPIENLQKGAEVLQSWGYKAVYDSELLKPQMFLSNSDENRFQSLKKALYDDQVKAIWCLRGGYGAIRLIPFLDKLKTKPKKPKLLIGFSDVTTLHMYFNQKWNWPTLHASLIDRLAEKKLIDEDLHQLKASVLDSVFENKFTSLAPINAAALKAKKISSSLVGGNLVVLTSSLGTPHQVQLEGKILFLEEIAERGYRVDRCLNQLKQAGVFKKARAVVLGDFIKGHEPSGLDLVPQTLELFFKDLSIPVFKGVECGHGERQRPLFFNTRTVLTCGAHPQMINYGPDYEILKSRN